MRLVGRNLRGAWLGRILVSKTNKNAAALFGTETRAQGLMALLFNSLLNTSNVFTYLLVVGFN